MLSAKYSSAVKRDKDGNPLNGLTLDNFQLPVLEGIVAKTWGKEDELKQLKSELAALDRKIASELAPKKENPNDGEEIKRDEAPAKTVDVSTDKTMVAEPKVDYSQEYYMPPQRQRSGGMRM